MQLAGVRPGQYLLNTDEGHDAVAVSVSWGSFILGGTTFLVKGGILTGMVESDSSVGTEGVDVFLAAKISSKSEPKLIDCTPPADLTSIPGTVQVWSPCKTGSEYSRIEVL
jgi:hypothetical protein